MRETIVQLRLFTGIEGLESHLFDEINEFLLTIPSENYIDTKILMIHPRHNYSNTSGGSDGISKTRYLCSVYYRKQTNDKN